MGEFHDLYLTSGVMLLTDVFEQFRKTYLEHYQFDLCWYYTSPGLSWDALLKHSKVELELLSDPDMLLFFEEGTRGGISMISNRFGKANRKYMKVFDPGKESKILEYLDVNNLYGFAMTQDLPVGDFSWMSKEKLKNWERFSCCLEVDLVYPKELHDLHNAYPLAPEALELNGVTKLVPNLWDKKKYVLHHENLKQYLALGLKLKKVHRGIRFRAEPWMKSYIEKNTALRMKAKNSFEKVFFKLLNYSVFGKTMENIRKRVDIRLLNDEKQARKMACRPNFKHLTIFDENLAVVHLQRTS